MGSKTFLTVFFITDMNLTYSRLILTMVEWKSYIYKIWNNR